MVSRLAWFQNIIKSFFWSLLHSILFCSFVYELHTVQSEIKLPTYSSCMFEHTHQQKTDRERQREKGRKKFRRRWNEYQEARDINTLNGPSYKPIIVVRKRKKTPARWQPKRSNSRMQGFKFSSYDSQFINMECVLRGETLGERERERMNKFEWIGAGADEAGKKRSLMIVRRTFLFSINSHVIYASLVMTVRGLT